MEEELEVQPIADLAILKGPILSKRRTMRIRHLFVKQFIQSNVNNDRKVKNEMENGPRRRTMPQGSFA